MRQALERPFWVAPPKDRFSSSLTAQIQKLIDQANVDVTFGPVLSSAPALHITAKFHHVSGTATIKNIVAPPSAKFTGGEIVLIPDGLWKTATGGNIGLASTAIIGKRLAFVFDGATYWPSY